MERKYKILDVGVDYYNYYMETF